MTEETTDGAEDSKESGDDKESALVPSSLFGGNCEVGDEYKVRITGKYDDELAIEHVSEKKDEDKSKKTAMGNAMDEMDEMAESKY